ncbi:MAG: hypothetical protein M3530_10775, partial [Thermoproteota archaeon]|nr:hypothetical protein [Thermoproteota archaeon]
LHFRNSASSCQSRKLTSQRKNKIIFVGTLTCHNVASNRIRTVAVAIVGSCQVCPERGECRLEALAVILVITALATSEFGGSIAIVLINIINCITDYWYHKSYRWDII